MKKQTSLKYIKVFNYRAYYKYLLNDKMKFQDNAIKGIFFSFSLESNCYIVIDHKTDLDRKVASMN
jgi:hypothetical protein